MSRSGSYTFGELLKQFRVRASLNQQELAEQAKVHRNTINGWEQGNYLPRSRALVQALADALYLDEQETASLLRASFFLESDEQIPSLSPLWNIPYARNPFFTGREDIIHRLHRSLSSDRATVLTQTISGLGGIGKTQTAIEYAYRYAHDYAALFWIAAETAETLISSMVSLAHLLHLPERQERDHTRVVAAVIRWLNHHRKWLLIFDNVEDPELVKGVLPAAREGSLLFTSRRQAPGFGTQILDLDTWTLEEGTRFLLRRAGLPASMDPGVACEIVTAMDGLPLALDQAGAYIAATRCSLSDYLHLLRSSPLRLLDKRDASSDYALSVTKTFTLAFERLAQSHEAAAQVLTVCVFLAPEAIPEAFFLEGATSLGPTFEALAADPLAFQDTFGVLLMYSLIQRDSTTHTLTVHRLVQTVLKESLSPADQRMWATRITHAMSVLFPSDEYAESDYWQSGKQLLPHALACLQLGEQGSNDTISYLTLLCHVAAYLLRGASYERAQSLLQQAVSIGEQVLGPEHVLVAEALHDLGSLCSQQGKYAEAEQFWLRALSIREQVLGTDHPQMARSFHSLGILYVEQGKYAEAGSFLQQALRIREQAFGADHPQVAASLDLLGILYASQGEYEQAEPLFVRALRIREQALGSEHPQVATLLNNLGDLYRRQRNYEQAEPLLQRALRIWEQDLGSDHPRVAYPLENLADLYKEQGNYEQAESLLQRALRIWERTCGPYDFHLANSLFRLADLRQMRHQPREALSLYQRALEIREHALGPNHPKTVAARTAYTHLLQEMGQAEEAHSPLHQAVHPSSPENDPLQGFLEACCELHPHAWCRFADLWRAYEYWVEDQQERYQLSRRAFIAQLKAYGCRTDRIGTTRIWRGITLVKRER